MSESLALVKESDLSLVETNSLNRKQLDLILKSTPAKYKQTRPAKGGGKWTYVTGGYIKKCLNLMFGWDWDFEILDEKIIHNEVVVKGRLTCRTNGKVIIKTQYGNKEIMYKKNTETPLSIGNDMKSAATDCLKKCASEIGIAADVYNADEFRELKISIEPETEASAEQKRIILMINDCQTVEDVELLQTSNPDIDVELFNARKDLLRQGTNVNGGK